MVGALAALMLLGLAACGSGSGGTDTTEAAGATTGETEATTGAADSKEDGIGKDEGDSEDSSGKDSPDRGGDDGSEGGKSEFSVPGGDNSIQNFGDEADDADREQVSETVEAFLKARAVKDWNGVCTYLAAAVVEPIEELVENNPQFKDAKCPELLAAIGKQAKGLENNMAEPVGSFRVKGDKGFALYHGTEGEDFAMPMDKEDGDWKVGAIEPAPLA